MKTTSLKSFDKITVKPSAQSVLDMASDLCGCVDGPTDLATNPKYMEGFGERQNTNHMLHKSNI